MLKSSIPGIHSAKKIYIKDNWSNTGWPNNIVCSDIEDLRTPQDYPKIESLLTTALKEDYSDPTKKPSGKSYYGRCVYESTNDVVDNQVVTITWDDTTPQSTDPESAGYSAKTATLTMAAHTNAICERRGRVYGSTGEVAFSAESNTITVYDFKTGDRNICRPQEVPGSGHGGGDFSLVNAFVGAIRAVKTLHWDVARAQREWIGMDIEECVRSHAVVWAAEEARVDEKVVKWEGWWQEVTAKMCQ